jgi:DNA/RNA endonuclease YhcR with UshA esterase domain
LRNRKKTFKTGEHEYSLLNFGDLYPNQKLTLIIKKKHLKNFSFLPIQFLLGKKVCVTGCVNLYKGKPQIKVKYESQIVIE